ncbi:adenylate/guanylate cyclase domain-containing protein [Pseudahrensia aquimaris]|uniref:Adenylate/guanylate cyclase domain-containing protein n=1 Tax=Pseudahrensia aquimaris TaxID=744461 RepID=A0ABW3FGP8_9HYPH
MNERNPPVVAQSRNSLLSRINLHAMRLYSGLVLFIYLVWHFINHSIGLFSLEMMSVAGGWLAWTVRATPFGYLLYAALVAHMGASLWQVYQRRSLKMPAREWTQLVFGLLIPPLMVTHIMGTRYAHEIYGINDSYAYVILATFVYTPLNGILNSAGLVLAWVHGCIGMHMWLQLKRFYTSNMRMTLLICATLLPTAALGGFLSAGREIAPLSLSGEWLEQYYAQLNLSDDSVWELIGRDTDIALYTLLALLGGVFAVRALRNYSARRANMIAVDYMDGPVVRQRIGTTLLDISRFANVPHAGVCGGKGRCSTCRVQIVSADGALEPPSEAERRVLERVNAPENVRLACQLRPTYDIQIMRLLPGEASALNARSGTPWATGQERTVAILFADIRNFTRTAEARLPFDVVYLINQFSREMGQAVEAHGGRIDKFLGDGLMAIFGIETTPEKASLQALQAAADMSRRLEQLNERLERDLPSPLRIGIGVHTGPVVLGDMGYGASRGLTAIGDTVNTSSRLEAETKVHGTLACISAQTAELAGIKPSKKAGRHVAIRGREQELDIFALDGLTIDQLVGDTLTPKAQAAVQ